MKTPPGYPGRVFARRRWDEWERGGARVLIEGDARRGEEARAAAKSERVDFTE